MELMDLFEREQNIHDQSLRLSRECKERGSVSPEDYEHLAREYGKLLRQIRRITRISDKTAEDLNASKQELLDKVHYDSLTGIYNRRYMEDNLNRVIQSQSRSRGILSLLMIDIDHFKKYNDTYGHSQGDICLRQVALALQDCVSRADDFVARYGGEEFSSVLPNTDEAGARVIAERMLEAVRALQIPHEKNEGGVVTISVGVTTGCVDYVQKGIDYLEMADRALYESKNNGRNRYTFIGLMEGSTNDC